MLRRAERAVGQAVRNGQEAGELRRKGQASLVLDQYKEVPSVNDFFGHRNEMTEVYALTDGVSEDEFEDALAEARDEQNLSRANVVRKVTGRPPASTTYAQNRHRRIEGIAAPLRGVEDGGGGRGLRGRYHRTRRGRGRRRQVEGEEIMLTLYYGSGSPYAWRVNLALEHKALPYERRVLSFAKGDLKQPEYLALNPRGKVPALRDREQVVTESLAIMHHLDGLGSGPALFGATPARSVPVIYAVDRTIVPAPRRPPERERSARRRDHRRQSSTAATV